MLFYALEILLETRLFLSLSLEIVWILGSESINTACPFPKYSFLTGGEAACVAEDSQGK